MLEYRTRRNENTAPVDDAYRSMLMTAILEDFGHSIICCEMVKKRLKTTCASIRISIDVDVVMPVVDGYRDADKKSGRSAMTGFLSYFSAARRSQGCCSRY